MIEKRNLVRLSRSAILTVLLLLLFGPVYGQLQDEREAFEYSQVLYSDGLYETAAEEFRRFILNYPTSERLAHARLRLAEAYYQAESLTEAVDAYQIFVDRHPDNIEVIGALRNRATALERLGEHIRAAAAFSDLYERFRTGEYAVQDLLSAGSNSRRAYDYPAAEQSLRTIITNHPSSPLLREAAFNLGLTLSDQGRQSEALQQFESIENSEREPDALLEIGRISLEQDNITKAERTFTELRKRFPRNRSAHRSYLILGEWYENQAEWSKAIKTYEAARSARLGTAQQQLAILGLARVYRETNRDGLQLYAQFLKVYPTSEFLPDARLGLGRAFVDKKQYRQAINAFKRLQESFPDHPFSITAHRDIGDVYAALGSPRPALAAYQRHLDRETDAQESSATRLSMGRVYREQLGWTDLAIETFSQLTITARPEIAASAQFQLGLVHESTGVSHLAIREYRNFLERFAGEPQAGEAERRIRYLSSHAPTDPIDQELIDLLDDLTSESMPARLKLGKFLFSKRHYDRSIPFLEAASADTAGTNFAEALYVLGHALNAIDRREELLDPDAPGNRGRILSIFSKLTDTESSWSDDAALVAIELKHPGADTASAQRRADAYDAFLKTHPQSDRIDDARLKKADTNLFLGRTKPGLIDLALADYSKVTRSGSSKLVEKAAYGSGRCLALKKDFAAAEDALRDFLFKYPNSSLGDEARFQLGLILLERGYLQSAAAEFADLLRAPTSVDLEKSSRVLLAECYYRLEDFASAIEIDETLLSRGAEASILKRLGESYSRTGESEKALSVLGLYVRKFSNTPGADSLAFRRAELLAQLGRTNQAIEAFDNVSTRYPKSALTSPALASVSRLYFEKQNYEAALKAVTGAGVAANEAAAELKIVTLLRLDRAKQARKEIKTFKKNHPEATESLARFEVEQARIQLRYGNPKGAQKTLEGVAKKYAATRSAADAEFHLIEALEKIGKSEEHFAALLSFVKNRKNNANWALANLELASIYTKDQDYVGASRAYLNALTGQLEESRRPEVLEKLYESHVNLRLYDSAISYARDLIEQHPLDSRAQDARISVGEIYSEKGEYEKSIAELRPLLTKLSGDKWSSAQYVIAMAYQKMDEYENALREHLKLVYTPQGSVNWVANSLMGRAQCFTALGRSREAIEELEKIRTRFSGTSFILQADQMIAELRQNQ